MIEYNTLIVLCGVTLLGMTAGVVGSFAVLRQRALFGDALAHASLPGICVAFLIFERRALYLLLAGALVSALVGILVVSLLRRFTRTKEDAAIGIVLSVFFGAGIVLSRIVQNRTTSGSKAGLDSFLFGKTSGMIAEDVWFLAFVSAGCIAIVWLLFKELKSITFDAGFAEAQGWPVFRLDLLMMALIAATVMLGLPAVGVVLVAAMLILPAASARFWTERFESMVLLSAGIGGGTGIVGTLLSARLERAPAGAVIVLAGSAALVVSMLLAPRRGLVARLVVDARFRRGVVERSLLRELFERRESSGGEVGVRIDALRSSGGLRTVGRLESAGLLRKVNGSVALTEAGIVRARRVTARTRLWQKYLLANPELATTAELQMDGVEQVIPRETVDELVAELLAEGNWPAGEPIPSKERG